MINRLTKYWSFTWDTNVKQKKLPSVEKLEQLLKANCADYVFQLEQGKKKKKPHYQGCFTLTGPRQSKIRTLELFREGNTNIAGLTISPVYDKVAIKAYVTKDEGRIEGPFYGGKDDMHSAKESKMELRPWQKELFEMLTGPDQQYYKDRKVIWIQNPEGGAGKSRFIKWLRTGQRKLIARALPISSVDRLISAVCILNQKLKVDVYTIDFTRSMGKDQSFKDLFAALEMIKNGQVIDVMYGRYNEAIFDPPMIVIFTNENIKDFSHYLSFDRWCVKTIYENRLNSIDLLNSNSTKK